MVEKPAPGEEPSNLAVIGRYILTPNIFKYIEKQKFGVGREIQLTNAIANEISIGHAVNGFRFEGQRFDCGTKAGFLQATISFALARDDLRSELLDYLHDLVSASKVAQ